MADVTKIDMDSITKDYAEIGRLGSSLFMSSFKNVPFSEADGNLIALRSTKTNYLEAVESTVVNIYWDAGLFWHGPAKVSDNFKNLMKDLGFNKQDRITRKKFMDGFDRAFSDSSELKNPAKLREALEAGFVEAAGSKENFEGLIQKNYPNEKFIPVDTSGYTDEQKKVLEEKRAKQKDEFINRDNPNVRNYKELEQTGSQGAGVIGPDNKVILGPASPAFHEKYKDVPAEKVPSRMPQVKVPEKFKDRFKGTSINPSN